MAGLRETATMGDIVTAVLRRSPDRVAFRQDGKEPSVSTAAVIGVPDDKWGEAVKALVVLRPGTRADAGELIALVRQRKGPAYAPKSIDFVESLPLTAVGKADKRALRARYWGGRDRQIG